MAPKARAGQRTAKDSKASQGNNDSEAKILCDEAAGHLKTGNYKKALSAYNSALELNPGDKNALVARSKCYLLLGEPQLALQDAETALQGDKSFIRGLFQKAESLYHLGDFEHSLMYYHRGLRLRPELESFRLGVQKAQEAIENTIGSQSKAAATAAARPRPRSTSGSGSGSGSDRAERARGSRPASTASQRQARHLLGELSLDKQYLEQLLRHPDIKTCSSQGKTNNIATFAEEGIAFLNNRQEFWRQQRPTTTSKKTKEHQQTTKTTQLVH